MYENLPGAHATLGNTQKLVRWAANIVYDNDALEGKHLL